MKVIHVFIQLVVKCNKKKPTELILRCEIGIFCRQAYVTRSNFPCIKQIVWYNNINW